MVAIDADTDQQRQLDRLRGIVGGSPAGALSLTIGTHTIELQPWVNNQLQQWSAGDGIEVQHILANVVSHRMTVLSHLEQVEVRRFESAAPSAEEADRLAARLDEGRRLVIDAQRAAKDLFAASRHHDSQQLQAQVEGLRDDLERLRRAVTGESEDPLLHTAGEEPAGEGARERARTQRRTRILLAVLLAVAAVRAAMFLLPDGPPPLPVLGPADFADLAVVEEVTARPPSLFLTVGPGWDDLVPEQRTAVVESVGERLVAAGYSGALLRDRSGQSRARWLRHSGPELVD